MLKRLAVGALLAFAVDPSLPAEAGSRKPLFNGKDLSGWKHVGAGEMAARAAAEVSYEPQRGPRPDDGHIDLQNHGKHDVVLFEEVAVRPLEK